MQTFKVVLDGIELSEKQTRQIADAVQETVMRELSSHDALFIEDEEEFSEISILPIPRGVICGTIVGPTGERGELKKLMEQEFGG